MFSLSKISETKFKSARYSSSLGRLVDMDFGVLELLLGTLVTLGLAAMLLIMQQRAKKKLPPGPRCWPVVGNMLQLDWSTQSLADLARRHGPVMTLWLGSVCTVVISSSDVAEEMYRKSDAVLAGRKVYQAMEGPHGTEGSLVSSQFGPHWRMLRRLWTSELFVTSRLDAMRGVRARCVDRMVELIPQASQFDATSAIEVEKFIFMMAFNLIGNLIFSKDLLDNPNVEMGEKFHMHAVKIIEYAGKPNIADFFPILKPLDPQRIRKNMQYHVEQAIAIAGLFIRERMDNANSHGEDQERKDFLDVLLEFRGDGGSGAYQFSSRAINTVIVEMFTAGSTDTTTGTIEWALAELLHRPETLEKVQQEIRTHIGPNGKVDEGNIENLFYLKAVINEALRLHPPVPFLVPHMALESCDISDYCIPKGSQVLVNVWAIGRDPQVWDAPLVFWPERFLEPNMPDYKGRHFTYIPFGSGRRMCPAVPLMSRVLPLALGSLLYHFDWILPHGNKPENMDMREAMGISLRKAVPLKVIPVAYKGTLSPGP